MCTSHHFEYVEESISLSPSFISSPLALLSGLLPRRSEGKLGGFPFLRCSRPPRHRRRSARCRLFSIAPSLSYLRRIGRSPAQSPFSGSLVAPPPLGDSGADRTGRRGRATGDGRRRTSRRAAGDINGGLAYLLRKTQIPLRDTILSPQRNASPIARPN